MTAYTRSKGERLTGNYSKLIDSCFYDADFRIGRAVIPSIWTSLALKARILLPVATQIIDIDVRHETVPRVSSIIFCFIEILDITLSVRLAFEGVE